MIHDTLRLIRIFHKYSIDKTSLVTKINPSDIRNIEAGKLDVSDVMIEKYATGFKMNADDIRIFSEARMPGESDASLWFRGRLTGSILRFMNWIYKIQPKDD